MSGIEHRPRPQVPPGTRDARTGEYIRKPVPVKGSGSKPPQKTCVCMVVAVVGGCGSVAADAAGRYVDLMGVFL